MNHRLLDVFLLLHMITVKFNHSCHLHKLQLFHVMHESGRHLTEMTHRWPSVSLENLSENRPYEGGMGWVRVRIKCKVKVIVIWGDNILPRISPIVFWPFWIYLWKVSLSLKFPQTQYMSVLKHNKWMTLMSYFEIIPIGLINAKETWMKNIYVSKHNMIQGVIQCNTHSIKAATNY